MHSLSPVDPRLFANRLQSQLAGTGVALQQFQSDALHPDHEAKKLAQVVTSRGMSACVLGLGPNGHLALNEPGVPFDAGARYVRFTDSTLAHLGGPSSVAPATGGMTLSLSTLMSADAILLVVSGAKSVAFERFLWGELNTDLPASVLRVHPNVDVMVHKAVLGARADDALVLPGVHRWLPGVRIDRQLEASPTCTLD